MFHGSNMSVSWESGVWPPSFNQIPSLLFVLKESLLINLLACNQDRGPVYCIGVAVLIWLAIGQLQGSLTGGKIVG